MQCGQSSVRSFHHKSAFILLDFMPLFLALNNVFQIAFVVLSISDANFIFQISVNFVKNTHTHLKNNRNNK